MQVKDTYCLDEWEKYYTEKPLSFVEFVDTYKNKDCIYPHIMKKIKEISEDNTKNEYYIQGILGSGKSTLIQLFTIYRIYLYLLLKSPSDFYNKSSNTEFFAVIFAPFKGEKTDLVINPILEYLCNIPFFAKARTMEEFEKVESAYTTASQSDDIVFKHNGNILHLRTFSRYEDLIGINIIIGVMKDLEYYIYEYDISYNKIYDLMTRLIDRIDSRCRGIGSTFILEKNPGDIWDDLIDQRIYSLALFDTHRSKLILFQKYWEIFKSRDPDAPLDKWINLNTGEITDKPQNNLGDYINFPSNFNGINFLEKARKSPKEFIKDFIGIPVRFGLNKKSYDVMKQIKADMEKYHIELAYKHGKMYLECYQDDVSLCLEHMRED